VALSDTVRLLRDQGYLRTTVAVGPCVAGERACVSVASALVACAEMGIETVVCAIGPGVVGTGTRFGHGALSAADSVNAAVALGGAPVLAPRVSTADGRERHRGLSHHTLATLAVAQGPVAVAWPEGLDVPDEVGPVEVVDVSGWRSACAGLPLSHMGRGPDEEPWFFAAAYAAGVLGRRPVA
jgi:hypothetical protein